MATNKLTEVAGLVAQAVMGAKVKDKDGNAKTVKPTGDDNLLDLTDIVASGSGTGGGDNPNPDNPSAGADYYAGSLADGEITERNLEWSGTDDPTKNLTVTFKDDPGSNPFGQYSGLTILGHIQKTVMTSGTKGAVSNLELNYDPDNAVKDGYFTTTSPYPIYIKQSDIASGQELAVPINGIGEGLEGDNTKPAMIRLKYNSDRTMTISHEDGYVNDGNSAGATGANYSFVVEIIATFSTQKAIAQLPPSVNVFNGSATGDITLAGISDFYTNSMDGLEITLDDYVYSTMQNTRFAIEPLGIKKTFRIPKDHLIINNKVAVDYEYMPLADFSNTNGINPIKSGEKLTEIFRETKSNGRWDKIPVSQRYYQLGKPFNSYVEIDKDSIKVMISRIIGEFSVSRSYMEYQANVVKVTPYKN